MQECVTVLPFFCPHKRVWKSANCIVTSEKREPRCYRPLQLQNQLSGSALWGRPPGSGSRRYKNTDFKPPLRWNSKSIFLSFKKKNFVLCVDTCHIIFKEFYFKFRKISFVINFSHCRFVIDMPQRLELNGHQSWCANVREAGHEPSPSVVLYTTNKEPFKHYIFKLYSAELQLILSGG